MLGVVRLLFPRGCPACGRDLGTRRGVCAECERAFQPEVSAHSTLTRERTEHLVSLGRYDGALRRAVRALKYDGARDVAPVLGSALARAVPEEWRLNVVCAVPLHSRRTRERGYNQAELIARALAVRLGLPCAPLLTRARYTRQQAHLVGVEREANVRGAFRAIHTVPECVLLVDDVLTTGSTLRACARILVDAGAERVYYAVAAR